MDSERDYGLFRLACLLARLRNAHLIYAQNLAVFLEDCRQLGADLADPSGLFQLLEPRLREEKRSSCRQAWKQLWVERDWQDLAAVSFEEGERALWPGHPDYPPGLLELRAPPAPLFYRAYLGLSPGLRVTALAQAQERTRLCVVGSRRIGSYGLQLARDCARCLATTDILPVSGLAYGTDVEVQGRCHEAGMEVWAVLAGGLDQIYPQVHQGLARKLAQQGALFSEQPPGVRASRQFFPSRNRIMTGLSSALLVLSAALRSGTMASVQHALDQNREIWVVPGSIYEASSAGCNNLIASGAQALIRMEELSEALRSSGLSVGRRLTQVRKPQQGQPILDLLRRQGASSPERLQDALGWDQDRLYQHLADLLLAGAIELYQGLYQLT